MPINGSILITVMWEGHTPPDMTNRSRDFIKTYLHLSFI